MGEKEKPPNDHGEQIHTLLQEVEQLRSRLQEIEKGAPSTHDSPLPELTVIQKQAPEERNQEALLQTEARYRRLVENLRKEYFFYSHDTDGIFTYISPSVKDILGYTQNEFLNHYSTYLTDNPINKEVENHTRLGVRGILQPKYEVEIYHKDGSSRLLEVQESPIKNAQGRVISVEGIAKDITEMSRAVHALRESEQRYRLLADNVSDVIWTLDLSLCHTYVSPSVKKLLGYDRPGVLIGTPLKKGLTPASYKFAKEIFDREMEIEKSQTGDPDRSVTLELEQYCADGTTVWTEVRASFLRDSSGKATGLLGVTRDISERRKVISALEESEEMFRAVFETARDCIFIKNLSLRYIRVNQAMENLLGLGSDQIIGKNDFEIHGPETGRRFQHEDQRVLTGGVIDDAIDLPTRNEVRTLHRVKVPLRNSKGEIVGLCGIARDITDHRRMEKEKMELERKLQQAQKMESIGTLAGGIAHDFNNSLQVMLGAIDVAIDDISSGNPAEVEHELKIVKQSARQMSNWTSDLLAYARGSFSQKKPIRINESIFDALKVVTHNLTDKIKVEKNFEEDIPRVIATPGEIEHIFVNLMINASEAIENRGRISITTGVVDRIEKGYMNPETIIAPFVHVVVEDDGIGMTENTLSRIFEPFFTTKFVGRGMGMAVVFGIVKSCDGFTFVQSEPEKGTQVHLYFPAVISSVHQ